LGKALKEGCHERTRALKRAVVKEEGLGWMCLPQRI